MSSGRGFTLLELMMVVAVVAILSAIGAFSVDRLLAQSRTDAAARNFLLDVRFAQAVATRTNRAVALTFRRDPQGGCRGPSYVILGTENMDPTVANAFDVNYRTVCIPDEHGRVTVGGSTAGSDFGNLACVNDFAGIPAPPLSADGCSFCGGGATGTLTFLPSGEVAPTPAADGSGIEHLAFTWGDGAADSSARVRVVTINTAGGRTRMLRPAPSAAGGPLNAWGCQ